MIFPWLGRLNVLFIAVEVADPRYDPLPDDWREVIERRIFYDPDPATGIDRSLRAYVNASSSGRARFDATVVGPVSVAGCGAGPAIEAVAASHLYDVACVVFPSGVHGCNGMAILRGVPFPYDDPRSPNRLLGWCRFKIDESLGTWVMEFLHAATGFDDLYKTSPHPGRFDEMACNCGTGLSSFTKRKLGWIPANAVRQLGQNEDTESFTLHAISLLQPPPPGRLAGLRIPTSQASRYFLVEARLRTDAYELGHPGLSAGIPSEGVVVYEVDETVWAPMKLRTPTALGVGQSFHSEADRVWAFVTDAVAGGFTVLVLGCDVVLGRLEFTRRELEAALRALVMWEWDGPPGGDHRAVLVARINELLARIADLRQYALFLGCPLPRLTVDTSGVEDISLELPHRGEFVPPGPVHDLIPLDTEPELGTGTPAHRIQRSVDLW